MEEPDSYKSGTNDVLDVLTSSQERSTSRRSTPGRSTSARSPSSGSTPGRSTPGRSTPGRSISGRSISGQSTSGQSTPDRSTTPEPPPVPPATYHWEEVRRKRTVGGYPWTHLNKPPFDENTWVKYERDHVYEPVTPTKASADRTSSSPSLAAAKLQTTATDKTQAAKDDGGRHFLRIPLTEELVMADEDEEEEDDDDDDGRHGDGTSGSERAEEDDEDDDEDDEEDDDGEEGKKGSVGSIDGHGEKDRGRINSNSARIKAFQQKVKVKADVLRTKLQGVTKRKPKQKIVVEDSAESEKRKSIASVAAGRFATLPKKFTFNAPKVNFSAAFGHFAKTPSGDGADDEARKRGRFSLPRRFAGGRFSRTSSESPEPSRSATAMGASRTSVPGLRTRTWSDASKASSSSSQQPKQSTRIRITDFGTYPRIFSKRRKTDGTKTPSSDDGGGGEPRDGSKDRSSSFRRRFFRSHTKESTPAPSEERQRQKSCSLAVEEEGLHDDALHGGVSKESLAEFGDSDLQEVISLGDDGCNNNNGNNNNNNKNKDTVSLRSCLRTGGGGGTGGVIEEIDSDEFFLREKGLSRGDVHISNYLSSEIRHVFRSNRTRSVEGINGGGKNDNNGGKDDGVGSKNDGFATPVRPSRTNSLRRPQKQIAADRFSTMPKSFGGTARSQQPTTMASRPEDDDRTLENIITSQTFEPSHNAAALPSTFRVPWRTAASQETPPPPPAVTHMPPKPPTRQRMTKFSTFDTRSMIDLSRKRSQSQIGFLPSMNFSDTAPKAPLRRSRTSLAGSERDVSIASDTMRPPWAGAGGVGAPTPPLRRSRMSLVGDVDAEESRSGTLKTTRDTPPRPPPPAAGYATVDKSLLVPPQSPARHRRKKSYDVIKSQEFGAFFTIPRSYSFNFRTNGDAADGGQRQPPVAPLPSRPARAYNTLGPSRPLRRRLPAREHEYGDVQDAGTSATGTPAARSSSPEDGLQGDGPAAAKALFSGDVIEKMKLRPLPSPPPPPRVKPKAPGDDEQNHQQHQQRRNTDSALVPFLDRREASATSSDDFFADVSRALLASAACNNTATIDETTAATAGDDVSIGVQTDPLPDGYELDDAAASRCSSRASSAAATDRRPTSRISAEYSVERPASRANPVENGYATMPQDFVVGGGGGVICAQRINVEELQVCRMTVADVRGQRMGVDDVKIAHLTGSGSDSGGGVMVPSLEAACAAATAAVLPSPLHHLQDDDASSSRVSSMYPELDSDEDRASVLAAPTPPRRRSKPSAGSPAAGHRRDVANGGDRVAIGGAPAAVDLSAVATDPSITELSCQLFRLCHSNVCSLFNKVVQQVVPEDTEKRRDLQAALCFLSIILAGLLILGFGNEKTIHHHHWDFQFPPPNQ